MIINWNKKALELKNSGNLVDSLILFRKSEELLKTNPSIKLQFLTFNNLACYYETEGNLHKSLHYLSLCANLKPNENSSQFFNIGILLNMAAIKSRLSNHKEALTHALKAHSLLETVQNQCLKSISYHSIGLEYEFLGQFSFALQYFTEGYTYTSQFFGPGHSLTKILANAIKICKKKPEIMVDQFCILRENTSNRGKSGFDIRSRGNTQKTDYYIKVDTTPWIEADNWKFKTSQTPKPILQPSLRKKFSRMSEDFRTSVSIPGKLEEKLNFIGKKLMTLNGQLSNIEKLFTSNSSHKDHSLNSKKKAAILIQRAFRTYLIRKKAKKMTEKINKNVYWKNNENIIQKINEKKIDKKNEKNTHFSEIQTMPFFLVENPLNKKTVTKTEKYIQTSRQGKRAPSKFKSLMQNICFLQKNIKGFLERRRYKNARLRIIKIQSTFRMYQVKKIFKIIKHAIIFIQQSYRDYIKQKKVNF